MQTITVKPVANGTKFLATGHNKQRTVAADPNRSEDWNLGNTAGALGAALGWHPLDDIRKGDKPGVYVNHSR